MTLPDFDQQIADALADLETSRHIGDWPDLLATVQQIRDGHPDFGPRLALAYLRQTRREARRKIPA